MIAKTSGELRLRERLCDEATAQVKFRDLVEAGVFLYCLIEIQQQVAKTETATSLFLIATSVEAW